MIQSDILSKTLHGAVWLYGRQIATNVINFGVMIVLARTLSPAEFGLVALAQVLLKFVFLLGEQGVGDYVIYDQEEGRATRAQAAFWAHTSVNTSITVAAVLLAPWGSRLYEEPLLHPIIIVFALTYFVAQLAAVPDALLRRSLLYRTLALRDAILGIATSLLALGLALRGWGAWSLVTAPAVVAPIRLAVALHLSGWSPGWRLRLREWRPVLRYSGNAFGANIANAIAAEGDTLIIGKMLGAHALGIYNMAWQSANMVCRNVSGIVGKLAMPSLSALRSEPDRLVAGVKRMLRLLGIITFPLMIGLFVVADEFILAVYGPQWGLAVTPMRILIVFAIRRAIGSPLSVIYNVVGRPDVGLKFAAGFVPVYIAAVVVGSEGGIIGVAVAVTIVRTLAGFVAFVLAARLLSTTTWAILRDLIDPLVSSCLMGIVVAMVGVATTAAGLSEAPRLVIMVLTGAITYLLLLMTRFRGLLDEILCLLGIVSRPMELGLRRLLIYA